MKPNSPLLRNADLQSESMSIDRLKPMPGAPRQHPKSQIRSLAKSFEAFGQVLPILIDSESRICQSWDCASKPGQSANYSVCTTWGVTRNNDIYLLHVFRERLEYPELKRKVREMAVHHDASVVLIEDAAAGTPLIQELRRERFVQIEPIKPQHDKVMRMKVQAAMIEDGKVYIPYETPWLADYLHELAMFPKGRFDDQVDSTSQALGFIGGSGKLGNLVSGLDGLNRHQQACWSASSGSGASDNWLAKHLGW